jgi:hypothetical protein
MLGSIVAALDTHAIDTEIRDAAREPARLRLVGLELDVCP